MRSQWSIRGKRLASPSRRWYVVSWCTGGDGPRPVGHCADDSDPSVARAADRHHRPTPARHPGVVWPFGRIREGWDAFHTRKKVAYC